VIGDRLKRLREKKGVYQKDVADYLGITTSAYGFYEQGQRRVDHETLNKLADYFHVSSDFIIELTNKETPYEIVPSGTEIKESVSGSLKTREIPIFSLIANDGDEIFAEESIIGWLPVPVEYMTSFICKVNDDSMSRSRISNGDLVYIKKQDTFIDNQAVLVKLPDNSLIIRKATHTSDGVILNPDSDNPDFISQFFSKKDITIIGIVVKVTFDFN
jgi:SOS-response transcriptional repressor LexA